MPEIKRRKAVTADVGGVRVGPDAPVVVQSMTNTDTADIPGTVQQVAALARAGSELVRVTVNNEEAAAAVAPIVEQLDKQGVRVPIIGDFHYNGHILLKKFPDCARALEYVIPTSLGRCVDCDRVILGRCALGFGPMRVDRQVGCRSAMR